MARTLSFLKAFISTTLAVALFALWHSSCTSPQNTGEKESSSAESKMQESVQAELRGSGPITVAFYNVENLFDTLDSPDTNDEQFLPAGDKNWDTERYNAKLAKLAEVISQLGDADGPEILGVCEVENRTVLEDLIKQPKLAKIGYRVVHQESPDERGIDNALIYKSAFFQVSHETITESVFPHDPDDRTRAILTVSGKLPDGKPAHFIINHFPSRSGGQEKSEPGRVYVASQVKQVVNDIMQKDQMARIFVMGDFNDEPDNKSILEILGANGSPDFAKKELFNAHFKLDQEGKGTYCYRGDWNMLDQIILTQGALETDEGYAYQKGSAAIFSPEWLKQQDAGKYTGYPDRTYAGSNYLGGYSDHFPVYIVLQK